MSDYQDAPNFNDLPHAPVTSPPNSLAVTAEKYQHLNEAFTRVTEDNHRLKEELSALKSKHNTETILNKLIVPYAFRAFMFMIVYCLCVFGLLIAAVKGYTLPSPVLQTLVGSTAAAVVGLVGMVLTGIFVGARQK